MAVGVTVGTGGTVWPEGRCAGAAADVQVRVTKMRSAMAIVAAKVRSRRCIRGPWDAWLVRALGVPCVVFRRYGSEYNR